MYKVIKGIYEGSIGTLHHKYKKQLWYLARLRSLKGSPCAICESPVGEYAYKPMTNKQNRWERICERCGVSHV